MADASSSNATSYEPDPVKISAWGQFTEKRMQYSLRSDKNDASATSQPPKTFEVKKYNSSLHVCNPKGISGVNRSVMPGPVRDAVYAAATERGIEGKNTDLVSINSLDGGDLTDGNWHNVELVFATDRGIPQDD